MASRRIKLASTAAAVAVVGAGYFLYSVFAAQAEPDTALAQAPLNTQVQVPPAFIMTLDDSYSMAYQAMFPTRSTQSIIGGIGGGACWSGNSNTATDASWSFFSSAGQLRLDRVGTRGDCAYFYVITGIRQGNRAIPPVDTFGFARSHVYGPSYFNPGVEYLPWKRGNGGSYDSSAPGAARIHPHQAATINLVASLFDEDARSVFDAFTGMRLPAGTRYRLTGNTNCGGLTSGGSGANRWREVGAAGHTMTATCTLYIQYWPATFFLPYTSNDDVRPTLSGHPGAYDAVPRTRIANACGTGCDMWRYQIRAEDTVAAGNFANWFTYYSNRNRATIAAATHALSGITNMRVGFFPINQHGSRDQPLTNAAERVTMYNMAEINDRNALYGTGTNPGANTLLGLGLNGSTPNLLAVNAVGQQFRRTDAGAPIQLACQKNAAMLFTDGLSNQGSPGAPAITGLGAPFDPTPINSMAAIATRYYLNTNNTVGSGGVSSLRTDMAAGRVPVPAACGSANPDPKLDCQSNLHMNFYAITLGARGNLYNPDAVPPQDPFTNPPAWTNHADDDVRTVDDMWHATVNTRGDFINARSPDDITAAMRRILANVASGDSPSGSIALTGARIGSGSLTVTPAYAVGNEGTDWSSTLTADRVTVNDAREVEFDFAWEASARMASQASRNVFFTDHDGVVKQFDATNVALSDLCQKPSGLYDSMLLCDGETGLADLGVSAAQAVDYLLGDTDLERENGGLLRDRSTILGDIVNSTPVVSAPGDDYGYRTLSDGLGSSYGEYLDTKKNPTQNRRFMVYAGANDGMLHAFDGGLTDAMARNNQAPDTAGGREKFAYVPWTSVGHMGNLLFPYDPDEQQNQIFQHRYYVDGPVVVSDAHYGGSWSTVLVGTTGAGGRSVFALDVANASRSTGSFSATDHLWEISDLNTSLTQAVRDNIGFVLGRPVIVPVKQGGAVSWKAIFGNGYNSASGRAVLFVVDIEDDATPTIRMIEAVETGTGVPSGKNGLGNVVVVDRWANEAKTLRGRDGYADTVYAGDQKGALWKFDLLDASNSVSTPLFVTRPHTEGGRTFRQPITGGITAAAGPGGGVMLFFGTGSFSFYGDPQDNELQTLYAVNDTNSGLPTAKWNRANLSSRAAGTDGNRRTVGTANAATTLPSRGWYVDLEAGERFVGYPNIATGVVFMPTYVPDPSAAGCSAGGSNWLFGLNTRTGAASLSSVRSVPGGELTYPAGTAGVELVSASGESISAPIKDVAVMTLPRLTPQGLPDEPGGPGAPPDADQKCWMMVTVAGAQAMYLPYPCGRQSWRQIQ